MLLQLGGPKPLGLDPHDVLDPVFVEHPPLLVVVAQVPHSRIPVLCEILGSGLWVIQVALQDSSLL